MIRKGNTAYIHFQHKPQYVQAYDVDITAAIANGVELIVAVTPLGRWAISIEDWVDMQESSSEITSYVPFTRFYRA